MNYRFKYSIALLFSLMISVTGFSAALAEVQVISKATLQDDSFFPVKLKDVTLHDAVSYICKDKPCYFNDVPDTILKKKIDVMLEKTDLFGALSYIAATNDLALKADGVGGFALNGLDTHYFVFRKGPSQSMYSAQFYEGDLSGVSTTSSGSSGSSGGSGSGQQQQPGLSQQTTATSSGGGQGVTIGSTTEGLNFWDDLDKNLKKIASKQGFYTIDKSSSSVYLADIPSKVKLMKNFLSAIDEQVNKQVELQVTIVEVRKGGTTKFGVDWENMLKSVSNKMLSFNTGGAFGDPLSPFNLGVTYSSTDWKHSAIIRAVENFADVSIMEKTNMLLRNNMAGSLSRGVQRSYLDSVTTVMNNNFATVTAVKGTVLSGLNVYVLPTIVGDTITLTFMPRITDLQEMERVTFDNNNQIQNPVLAIRKNIITVTLKDGETRVVASLSQNTQGHTDRRVPLIGRIPLLGWMFGSTELQDEETCLLFIITPKLINV